MLKKQIIFKSAFYSKELGHIWIGRVVYVSVSTAKNMVNAGLAVYAKDLK